MSDPAGLPAGRPPSPGRTPPVWLLALGGLGLFLAGGIVGAIMTISITLYRATAEPSAPVAALHAESCDQPTLDARPTTTATSAPTPTRTLRPTPTPVPVGPGVGQEAPPFTLAGLDGITYTLSAYRGQTVLVNFWASWCPPCQQEWPELRAFAQQSAPTDVVILAVNVEESIEAVRDFAGAGPWPFPILLDRAGGVSERYRVTALPTTFVIGPAGTVLQVVPGNMDAAALRRLIEH